MRCEKDAHTNHPMYKAYMMASARKSDKAGRQNVRFMRFYKL